MRFFDRLWNLGLMIFCGWSMGNNIGQEQWSFAAVMGLLGIYFAIKTALIEDL